MVDELASMEGVSQHIRPSRQSTNSPTRIQGNPNRTLAKPKNRSSNLQKFSKSCPPPSGQWNSHPNQNKSKGYQNPQKKGYLTDKRPQRRGIRQNERFNQLAEDDHEVQLDYDFPVTSKRDQTSLNHLLNFTFAPREQAHHVHPNKKRNGSRVNYFNKEQFLQANCQFVVQEGGDYTINIVDPDVIVEWELIEQVRVRCREMPSCPICLYPPTAAQMTRCGHIYCWSCILHYLSLSEKTWRKCPICYESIHKDDLKSVMAVSEHKHSHGQTMKMTLMKRTKGSVFAMPKSRWMERDSVPLFTSDELEIQFSKLLVASPQEILTKVMAKDRSELTSQLLEVQNDKSEEEPFVKSAMEELEKREQRLLEMCDQKVKNMIQSQAFKGQSGPQNEVAEMLPFDDGLSSADTVLTDHDKTLGSRSVEDRNMEKKSMKDKSLENETSGCGKVADDSAESESLASQADNLSLVGHRFAGEDCSRSSVSSDDSVSLTSPAEIAQFYYFYQAEDGQNIFLHPVNARCLIKEYGSLEKCPGSIFGDIVEMECYSQTEELRHRFRYLRHLPLTCEFAICELDLRPPILSRETLDFFKDDLRKRRLRRQKKAKEEARHDKKCSSKFASFTGIKQPRINRAETPDLSSEQDFPVQVGSSPEIFIASSPPTSGPWSSITTDEEGSRMGPTFAKALSSGKCSDPKPRLKVRTLSESSRTDSEKRSEDGDEDDCEAVPSFQSAFTDALMTADWNWNVAGTHKDADAGSGVSRGKKSKRKSKEKRLLFSTGSAMKL